VPEVITIVQQRLPFHPLLGRNIRVDSRSLAFPFTGDGLTPVSGDWRRHVGPFDQGEVGSCTGNAAIGKMATSPYFETVTPFDKYSLDEGGAVNCYSTATRLDTYSGEYLPTDTGSDGTAVAQAVKNAGMISGYTHAATGKAARLALGQGPIIVGVKWFNSMFGAGEGGRMNVDRSSGLAGGHEIVFDMIDVEAGQVWFTQSWGSHFGVTRDGVPGRAFFTFADFDGLIADQGDATVFTPKTAPAPTPTPVPAPPTPAPWADDADLWAAGKRFTQERHVVPEYRRLATVLGSWGAGRGFTL
jgi:hypothetical protein